MAIQLITRGPKVGVCNVCGTHGPLTEDHTPPKGCSKVKQVELQHLSSLLSQEANPPRGRISQNGVKYRTLCAHCNNGLLGAKYDPPFIDFVNSIHSCLTTSLVLPDVVNVPCQPQAIMRSLIGHVSAQGVDRYLKGPLTNMVREYMFDESCDLPEGLNIYVWTYPYRPHIMVRDAAYLDIPSGKSVAFWLLKFFPVAFALAWGEPAGWNQPVHRLSDWRGLPFAQVVDLQLRLRPCVPPAWPEAPTTESAILYGQEAIHAVPYG